MMTNLLPPSAEVTPRNEWEDNVPTMDTNLSTKTRQHTFYLRLCERGSLASAYTNLSTMDAHRHEEGNFFC